MHCFCTGGMRGASDTTWDPEGCEPTEQQSEILSRLCLKPKETDARGNCQFDAVGGAVGEAHDVVRQHAVDYIRARKRWFAGFVMNMTFDDYVAKMGQLGTWGDNLTLQALAEHYGRRIVVISDRPANPVLEIEPQMASSETIYVLHYAEIHYEETESAADQADSCLCLLARSFANQSRQDPSTPCLHDSHTCPYDV